MCLSWQAPVAVTPACMIGALSPAAQDMAELPGRWRRPAGWAIRGQARTVALARLISANNSAASQSPVRQDHHARLQFPLCWAAWPPFPGSWSATSSVGVSEPGRRPAGGRPVSVHTAL